jgi:peroxiredoxin
VTRHLVGALLGALLLAGCSGEDAVGPPSGSNVDVDTPELRQMKAAAGIEDCEPGPGGGELPDLTLPCLGGGPDVELSSLTGPLILNVWYSTCRPCQKEMPAFQSFYAEHGETVVVVGLDVEVYPDLAISFADTVGATYPQIADPGGEILDQADVRVPGFPQSFMLDDEGRIVHQFGPIETEAELVALAEEHLEVDL